MPVAWTVTEQSVAPEASAAGDIELPDPSEFPQEANEPDSASDTPAQRSAREAAQWRHMRRPLREALDRCQVEPWRQPVDWRCVVDRVARHQALLPLPRKPRPGWPGDLVLVLDRNSESMRPFQGDMDALVHRLRRSMGQRAVAARVLLQGTPGLSDGWPGDLPTGPAARQHRPKPRPWSAWAGRELVVVSDLGAAPAEPGAGQLKWLQQAARAGARAVVLAPAPLPALARQQVRLLAWGSPGGRPQPPTCGDVRSLLALLAALGPVPSSRLRSWARRLRSPAADPALSWAVWNHPHVRRSGDLCGIDEAELAPHDAAVQQLDPNLLWQAFGEARRQRAWHCDADEHLVVLRLWELAPQLHGRLATGHAAATRYLALELPSELERAVGDDRLDCAVIAANLVQQAHSKVRLAQAGRLRRLQSLSHRDALLRQELVHAYPELGPVVLPPSEGAGEGALGPPRYLVQRGMALWLADARRGRPRFGSVLAGPLAPTPVGEGVVIESAGQSRYRPNEADEVWLADLASCGLRIAVAIGGQILQLEPVQRPRWAQGWWQGSGAPEVLLTPPWTMSEALTWPAGQKGKVARKAGRRGVSIELGVDSTGLHADLQRGEELLQRFRYIAPGSFLMGSPEGMGDSDEHPQHHVTLTEGYWLADTPCTQGLWKAVMGSNPSQFSKVRDASERPVENVSWDDVQEFLGKLRLMLPESCEPELPTEAQWECAARAGSQDAYWWGNEADDAKANWNRQHGGTTAVKRFGPNPWGLYDVHGNVWEWCRGGLRKYLDRPEVDPQDEAEGASRALRGGSWIDHPVGGRAAYRLVNHRDYRWHGLGFRLALRSPSQAGGAGTARLGLSAAEPATAVVGRGAHDPSAGRRPADGADSIPASPPPDHPAKPSKPSTRSRRQKPK